MKSQDAEKNEFLRVLEKFIEHTDRRDERNDERNDKRMTQLSEVVADTNVKMGALAEVVAASEERHIANQTGMERLGELTAKTDAKLDKTIDRVVNVEKQVLLLDSSEKRVTKRFDRVNGVFWAVITAVIIGVVLIYLGLK